MAQNAAWKIKKVYSLKDPDKESGVSDSKRTLSKFPVNGANKCSPDENAMEYPTTIQNKIAIEQMLSKLSDKEKSIIIKRYFKNKTQTELADELGVSQAQVSRIEKNALEKIKKKMSKTK